MTNYKRKIRWKSVISAALAILVVVGSIAVISLQLGKKTDTVSFNKFHRGAINASGEHVECKTSLYSDFIGAKGLTVEPSFEFDGLYEVFYYNYEKEYLDSTGEKTSSDKTFNVNDAAAYARIMITPNERKDIALWEIPGIVNQLNITTLRDQDMNIFDPATGERNKAIGIKYLADENGHLIYDSNGLGIVEGIYKQEVKGTGYVKYGVNNNSEFLVVFDEGSASERRDLYVFIVGQDEQYVHFDYIPAGINEYRISLPDDDKYSSGATAIYINYDMNNPFELYRLR